MCDTKQFEIKMAALLHDIGKPASYVEDANGSGHFYGHPKVSYKISQYIFDLDLRLTNEEADRIGALVLNHDVSIALTEKSVKRAISKFGTDFMEDYFVLHKADVKDHIIPEGTNKDWVKVDELRAIYDKVLATNDCFRIKDLAINGNDVKEILKIKGSPIIGEILNYLLDGVLEQRFENTKECLTVAVLEYQRVQTQG
jgi:tRNA nucleotidyltransferase (CCA-adding enzyme)